MLAVVISLFDLFGPRTNPMTSGKLTELLRKLPASGWDFWAAGYLEPHGKDFTFCDFFARLGGILTLTAAGGALQRRLLVRVGPSRDTRQGEAGRKGDKFGAQGEKRGKWMAVIGVLQFAGVWFHFPEI